jgi:uncharacterized protein (DUF1778 family)
VQENQRRRRESRISVRLRSRERALVEAAATAADESVSDFARQALFAAVRRAERTAARHAPSARPANSAPAHGGTHAAR